MEAEAGPSKKQIRTSQREVKSCGFCYRRKVKCDKVFPCSRCVSRGLGDLCEQESVIVNGRLTGTGHDRSVRRQPTLPQLVDENKSLHRKLNAQERIIRSLMQQLQDHGHAAHAASLSGQDSTSPTSPHSLAPSHGTPLVSIRPLASMPMSAPPFAPSGTIAGGVFGTMRPFSHSHVTGTVGTPSAAVGSGVSGDADMDGDDDSDSDNDESDRDDEDDASDARSSGSPGREVRAAELDREEYLATVGQVYGLSGHDEHAGARLPVQLFAPSGDGALDALRSLVPLKHSSVLVRWHCTYLHWIHPVVHVPTFLRDHDAWVAALLRGEHVNRPYDFYALYFAVIACSLYFMDEQATKAIEFDHETVSVLPRFWFDTSLNCIQLSGFMIDPTLPALQAICVLPSVAHAFGSSKYLSSLMHSALGLARDLHFHLVTAKTPAAAYGGVVRSELVRRVWWCLKLMDSLSPNAQHPFHLSYPPALTSPPANIEDDQLADDKPPVPLPLNHTTSVSHLLIMGRLADIFREFSTDFQSKQSLSARFRCVKAYDDRLNHLFDDMPVLRPEENEVYTSTFSMVCPFDWRPWSRFLWATGVSTSRIQLYRWFLGRSYSDARFAEARQVCVAAARTTLAAREIPVPPLFRKNWHVASYTVISGMVLAVELAHGNVDGYARRRLRNDVDEALGLLRADPDPNAMTLRGIRILGDMLAKADSAPPRPPQPLQPPVEGPDLAPGAVDAGGVTTAHPVGVDMADPTLAAATAAAVPMMPDGDMSLWPNDLPLDLDSDLLNILLNSDPWSVPLADV